MAGAGSQSAMGRLQKSGMTKAKKGKMMIMIAIGKPKKASKITTKRCCEKVRNHQKSKAIPGDPRENHC